MGGPDRSADVEEYVARAMRARVEQGLGRGVVDPAALHLLAVALGDGDGDGGDDAEGRAGGSAVPVDEGNG